MTAALSVLWAVMGCSPGGSASEQPHLVVPGDGLGGAAKLPNVTGGVPYSLGSLTVCLDRPGRATIEAVTMAEPSGGLAVRAFAVRPNPMEAGAVRREQNR